MVSLAHVVQPTQPAPGSDLVVAQPISFESMLRARELAREQVTVDLCWVPLQGEDPPEPPPPFRRLPALTRSVLDTRPFATPRRLPLIADILDRLVEHSDADYLLYSNVDIGLQPCFYLTVAALLRQGHEALAINRRTLRAGFAGPEDLPLIYAEIGQPHPGWDCFVFPRHLHPRLRLGTVCVGAGWFGRALVANLAVHAAGFRVFTDLHATFHVGDRSVWRDEAFADYTRHNREECRKILAEIERERGPLDPESLPGRFAKLLAREGA